MSKGCHLVGARGLGLGVGVAGLHSMALRFRMSVSRS